MTERKIKYPEYVNENKISIENFGYDNDFRFILKVPFLTEGKKYLRVIMKNPSVASESKCDMTMRKVCAAAYEAKYDGLIIMNLFPFRSKNATDVYEKFYSNKNLFEKAIEENKKVIKNFCKNGDVVFAWGTNTINSNKEFSSFYDTLADEITQIALENASCVVPINSNSNTKYPLHGLRWSKTILLKNKEKEIILHRNLYGPRAEIESLCTKEDYEIYCYKKHAVCIPDCTDCRFFAGTPSGLETDCLWEDFKESAGPDGHIVEHHNRYNELERVKKAGLNQKQNEFVCTQDESFKTVVYIAMSEEQAQKQSTVVCIQPELPLSKSIYMKLNKIPDEMCVSKTIGWEKTICAYKKDAEAIFDFLYNKKIDFDFNPILNKIDGNLFWLIGFDD